MIYRDKRGRKIEIEVDGANAIARHAGRIVGSVETTGEVYDDEWHSRPSPPTITGQEVDEAYRRAGIGLALIGALSEAFQKPLLPGHRNEGIGGTNALTDEGEALVRAAQARGYIRPFPEERPDDDDW